VTVRRGDRITVRSVTGQWTVDHRDMPMTGPAGYDADTDRLLDGAKSCKVEPDASFGTLLARLAAGGHGTAVRAVGAALTFRATADGTLQLGINDAESCGHDNKGTVTVRVSVTHQP
jgi:eukaryotic-like serine/threonine-protein kinase